MRLLIVILCLSTVAFADASRDAGKHFQRGVELYNDGDFRGALVEFKKAYEIWPRANVLYDIGQTEFQLMDYAGALTTMNRYLAETGPTAAHRAEVETTVETLRGRVGRVIVQTDASGCELRVDDEVSGTTPIQQPILVSVGQRKITVSCTGRPAVSRSVEVSAGERVEVELRVPGALVPRAAEPARVHVDDGPPSKAGFIAGWTVTGLLVAATVGVGSATLVQSSRLQSMKSSYPVMRTQLDRQGALVDGLSITSDVLGACALVAAAVSTWATVKYHKETRPRRVALSF